MKQSSFNSGQNLTGTVEHRVLPPGVNLIKPQPGSFAKSLLFLSLSLPLSLSQCDTWTSLVNLAICLSISLYFLFTDETYIPRSEHLSFGEGSEVVWLE